MFKQGAFSHLEKTLNKAQELITNVIEQNVKWPGGGAFEHNIATARNLIKQAQTESLNIGMAAYQSRGVDVVKSVNDRLNQSYQLLSLMHQDTKKIRISLERGESQSKAIKNLEVHLKKFIKHCKEVQTDLLNVKG